MIRCYITNGAGIDPTQRADWIQIREKDLPARDLLAMVRRALALPGKILVNTR